MLLSNLNSSSVMCENSLSNVQTTLQAQSSSLRNLHDGGMGAGGQGSKEDVIKLEGK